LGPGAASPITLSLFELDDWVEVMLGAYASIAGERLSCSGGVVIDRFEWEEEAGVMKGLGGKSHPKGG
jgi:hypothetical protein